jgi:hypothetical protein
LRTHAVNSIDELKVIIERLRHAGVRMTINTDGTYLLGTHLRSEFNLLLAHGILDDREAQRCVATARSATFIS